MQLLPADNSKPIVPPSDTELAAIIESSRCFAEIAPYFPEVIELDVETGMRKGELFNLHWRSVDFSLGDTGGFASKNSSERAL